MTPSVAAEQAVHRWVAYLEQVFDRILRCAVTIDIPHRHHQRGRTFHVHVEVGIPSRTIAATRDRGVDKTHDNVYVAIADAFRAARRQLLDHVRSRREVPVPG